MILSHRIEMTISLGTGSDEVQVQNALPLYVLLAKPVSDITVSEHSAVYQIRRTCILKAFSEFGSGDKKEVTFVIPELRKLSGGVTSMDAFLIKFFSVIYRKTNDPGLDSNYCKYDNHHLQLFTSSLYLAGLTSTFFASYTTRNLGSAAQYPFLGSSANLNLQQVAGNNSYVDVEFIDPVIMAVSRGKLPLPVTHQISPNYSSNMLVDFSKMDQRLQLLQSRSSNLN